MTPQEARNLRPGDQVQTFVGGTRGLILKVARVNIYAEGVVSVEVIDDEGREGLIHDDMIAAIERAKAAEPEWWVELFGENGAPRD